MIVSRIVFQVKGDRMAQVVPVLEEMQHQGYWLSDELLDLTRRLAGE